MRKEVAQVVRFEAFLPLIICRFEQVLEKNSRWTREGWRKNGGNKPWDDACRSGAAHRWDWSTGYPRDGRSDEVRQCPKSLKKKRNFSFPATISVKRLHLLGSRVGFDRKVGQRTLPRGKSQSIQQNIPTSGGSTCRRFPSMCSSRSSFNWLSSLGTDVKSLSRSTS